MYFMIGEIVDMFGWIVFGVVCVFFLCAGYDLIHSYDGDNYDSHSDFD